MKKKDYFGFRKSKTYGLCGVVLATALLSFGASVSAEETTATSESTTQLTVETSDATIAETVAETTETTITSETQTSREMATSTETSSEVTTSSFETEAETTTSTSSEVSSQEASSAISDETTIMETESFTTFSLSDLEVNDLPVAALSASLASSATASQELVTAKTDDKSITIQYNQAIASNEKIMFAVWGDPNDQNDLIWYTASAAGAAYIDLSKHKEYGKYNIHTYANRNGQMVGLDTTTITIATDVKVAVTSKSTDAFTITVSNVPDSISSVTIPVWTDNNNQDDIKWYTAQKTASKTYTVTVATKDHNSEFGHYNIHVYGQSTITGGLIGLSATDGYNNVDNRKTATVSLVNYAENKTSFDVTVVGSSSTKTLTGVRIAAWSEDKGQDDLKWYAPAISNNQAKQTISITDLSNTSGNYTVHVYTDYTDGTSTGTNLGTFKITKPVAKTEVTSSLTSQGIALHVSSTEVKDYKKVKFAVWSQEKDQDDIKWYDADSSGNALALYTDHSGYGTYNIHTYSFENGRAVGLAVSTIELPKPSAKVAVEKTNDTHYKIIVTETPQYITSVTIPVWSNKNDQDDIKWTSTSKNADGSYTAIVSLSDHKLDTGQYQAHVYANSLVGNNSLVGLGVTSFTVEQTSNQTGKLTVSDLNTSDYTLTATISEVATKDGLKAVKLAVWTEDKGQDDIQWQDAYKQADGSYKAIIRLSSHSYVSGSYNIHLYYDTNNGMKGVATATKEVNLKEKRSNIQNDLNDILNQYNRQFGNLSGDKSFFITSSDGVEFAASRETVVQRSASTIKLFILAAAYQKEARGELNMSANYTIKSSDIVAASTVLTGTSGQSHSLADIARYMVQYSDNTATNIMINAVGGVNAVNDEIRRMGYTQTTLNRYMRIPAQINAGLENYINVHEAVDLMKNIYNGTLQNNNAEGTMLADLSNNYYKLWLPANIQGVAQTWDKPGNDASYGVENDIAAIKVNGKTYIVGVLTQHTGSNGLTNTGRFAQFGSTIVSEMRN
ncbi:GBS Bsp-like repeat-containing protein [Streptococcus loxodontisalivarius]|uniref:Beta-lactamase class A n=1 Tax=Streptococcus loxodontisalivarius TaxID=1349415 RepID=A0ABS2PSW7_9STRE|nr:GBS Bsp-like repeat-containing protein [Streptococcus loxodontisalivarius]MBM7643016.1 beta-lactamase class A [Streptococcus loxodontisalivarius]